MGNNTASATGVTDKTGHSICSYIEKCPSHKRERAAERAWAMDGLTNLCLCRIAESGTIWCSAQRTWPLHQHLAMSDASPGMFVIPSHILRPSRHDHFWQCRSLRDPRSASGWALSLLSLTQVSQIGLTGFILQVTPPSSCALPQTVCFRHHQLVSLVLCWISPPHLYLQNVKAREEGPWWLKAVPQCFCSCRHSTQHGFPMMAQWHQLFLKVRYWLGK